MGRTLVKVDEILMSAKLVAIGIDFGGTTIKSAVICGAEVLEYGEVIDTQKHPSVEGLLGEILRVTKSLRGKYPEVVGIGVGLPGLVDSVNGVVHELSNVPGWKAVRLRELLELRTGLPVVIENDAKAMAYGECRYGAAKDGRHVLCITLGTGVGGALILDGRLYRGAQLAAGEIGHASIDYRGKAGPHGNPGGIEEYVGNQQIAERAVALYAMEGKTVCLENATPRDLVEAAKSGDLVALRLWEMIGMELGCALVNAIWLLNPDAIVIGGGVAQAGDLLFEPVRRTIRERTQTILHETLRVVPAALGNDAGMIGCATLAVELVGGGAVELPKI
ncbi:MAG: ROK family protein [Verrucomicrobiota bacterium]